MQPVVGLVTASQKSAVQAIPSLHRESVSMNTQPLEPGVPGGGAGPSIHESIVQGIPSSQIVGVKTQTPFTHTSVVHERPSLQIIGVNTHPIVKSQVSVVQALKSLQMIGTSTQVPLTQKAITHELVGTHMIGEAVHPKSGLQVSFTVHKSVSVQLTGE